MIKPKTRNVGIGIVAIVPSTIANVLDAIPTIELKKIINCFCKH